MASAIAASIAKSAAKSVAISMVKSAIPEITGKMKEIIQENQEMVCAPEFPRLLADKVIEKTANSRFASVIRGSKDVLMSFAQSLQQSDQFKAACASKNVMTISGIIDSKAAELQGKLIAKIQSIGGRRRTTRRYRKSKRTRRS
jgi:hypothetical protein